MSEPRSLVVVSAGLSQPSSTRLLADRLAAATEQELHRSGIGVERRTIELREHAQDLVSQLVTNVASPSLQGAVDAVLGADGLVAVSPIFNASYSGLFKLFFDVIEHDALAGVPALLGATGGSARHSLAIEHAMRPLFAYLRADVVSTAVYAATEDWGQADMPADASLAERIGRAGRDLATAVASRERTMRRDEFEDPVPFEELLRRSGST
ncbi:MAG TPA: FMN reductase [Candidatus Limnocylindria bacterium]|nr:FMN reductase [Candidatus Limnocylindria bacterium]